MARLHGTSSNDSHSGVVDVMVVVVVVVMMVDGEGTEL